MILRANVKVSMTFSTKKLDNLAMLGARILKLRGDVGLHQQMKPKAKVIVKVTVTFSTKNLDNCAMLGARARKIRKDDGPYQKMTPGAKVKVTVTSSTIQAYN